MSAPTEAPTAAKREGKTKELSPLMGEAGLLNVRFKDDATAFNAEKKAVITGKGELNAKLSAWLFRYVEACGLSTCFVREGEKPNELIYRELTMLPIEVIVRNVAYGSLCKRYPQLAPGQLLDAPLVEFCLKDDAAGDPVLTEGAVAALKLLPERLAFSQLRLKALQLNEALQALFSECAITCADFKLEFGLDAEGKLTLGDELSPDSFRLRDKNTGQVLDKDVFRLDLGDLKKAYQTVWDRLASQNPQTLAANWLNREEPKRGYQASIQVQVRPNVLHPESRAILTALQTLGFESVTDLKQSKRFQLSLDATSLLAAESSLHTMADQILSNPVIEGYSIDTLEQA